MICRQVRKDRWSHLADRIAPYAISETDTHWRMPVEAWEKIARGDRPPQPKQKSAGGPGTELKRLLGWLGIKASPTCSCNRHAAEMDRRGPQWCRDNIDTILGWLRTEAYRQGRAFSTFIARRIVLMAIRRAGRMADPIRNRPCCDPPT